jgi:hypothetical protein
VLPHASEETQPRSGATLDRVKRPAGILVPRARQAPDGRKQGGSHPTDSRRINRRILLAPALLMPGGKNHHENLKKSLATLEWVGTKRGILRPVSPSPPLPPCMRLSPHTATACQDHYRRFLSASQPGFPGIQGRSSTLTHLTSCGPSPCTRLSRAQSTMATLTPSRRIRGFLEVFPTPYFRSRYHRQKGLPSS